MRPASAGLCYCIYCEALGQAQSLQPGDSITAADLAALRQQAEEAAHNADKLLLHQAAQMEGCCVLPDLLTALAVGVCNSAAGWRQDPIDMQGSPSLNTARQVLNDLLLSGSTPEGLQPPPSTVLSLAECRD